MIEVKKCLAIYVIAFCISSVYNMLLRCEFKVNSFYTTTRRYENMYHCRVSPPNIYKLEDFDFLNVIGRHDYGKSHKDVELLYFHSIKDTSYLATFPKLHKVFRNLRYIYFYDTNITGISSYDLKFLPDLQGITFDECKISSLPSRLFEFNLQLEMISIEDNYELNHIGVEIFNNLPKLQYVRFKGNKCLGEEILCEGQADIEVLSERISSSSCASESGRLVYLLRKSEKIFYEKIHLLENFNNNLTKYIDKIVKNQEIIISNMNETMKKTLEKYN